MEQANDEKKIVQKPKTMIGRDKAMRKRMKWKDFYVNLQVC